MKEKTVRELSGEIWAEMNHDIRMKEAAGDPLYAGMKMEAFHRLIDIAMGVLARYDNAIIRNDHDIPVAPWPKPIVPP